MDKWEFLIWRAILSGIVETREDSANVTFSTSKETRTFARTNDEYPKAAQFLLDADVNLPGLHLAD